MFLGYLFRSFKEIQGHLKAKYQNIPVANKSFYTFNDKDPPNPPFDLSSPPPPMFWQKKIEDPHFLFNAPLPNVNKDWSLISSYQQCIINELAPIPHKGHVIPEKLT